MNNMNKKIVSLIGTAALALALASCSGDLHDVKLTPIDLSNFNIYGGWGSWTGVIAGPLTGSDNVYIIDDFDGKDDTLVFVPGDGTDAGYKKVLKAGSLPEGVSIGGIGDGYGGTNPTIEGLQLGYTYRITIDSSTGEVVVSIDITQAPEPADVSLDVSKLVVLNGNFGSTEVIWQGGTATVTISKDESISDWGSGCVEFALCEDSFWNGKVTTFEEADPNSPLGERGGNVVAKGAALPLEKDLVLTFTFIPKGTWQGKNNSFASADSITVSYSLL